MADFAALPLFTDSYLADTRHLSDADHGRYLQLLMLMWRTPDCRVPNDDNWLARKLARTIQDVVDQIRPLILEFCQCDGNWITQKRLLKEWNYVRAHSQKMSELAKSRWNKEKEICDSNAAQHSVGNAPTPTPTPTPSKESISLRSIDKARTRAARLPPDWTPNEQCLAYARELGLNPTRIAEDFCDFWHSKSGANATKVDWDATWRTWCRRAADKLDGQGVLNGLNRNAGNGHNGSGYHDIPKPRGPTTPPPGGTPEEDREWYRSRGLSPH